MTRRRAEPHCLLILLAACAAGAQAQQGAAGGTTVQPRIGLTQTWTDNLRLDDSNKDAALITTVSPGISMASRSGALRGSLDYSLNGIYYLKSSEPSRVQNALSANGQAELISRTLYVDVRATIGQQNLSAFGTPTAPTLGTQGSVSNLANANQRETGTLTVSPSLRGVLGGLASYDLRGDFTRTEARGSSVGDSRGTGGSLRVNQLNAGVLSWWAQANTQRVTATEAAANRNESLRLGLNYRPDPDWLFVASAGQERSNYLGNGNQNGTTAGLNAEWTPTPRTRVGADWQHHSYGDTHALTFEHRMSRSVWRYTDTQTVTLGNTGATGGVRSNYDQLFLLYASSVPDPAQRDAQVRADLQRLGLSPDAPAATGFLSSGPSRLRNQLLGITLLVPRGSVSAQASRAVTSRLGNNINQGDLANTSRVEQRSYTLSASHQLTPLSGLSLTASRQETTGDATARAARLTSVIASWNARLGQLLNGQFGARHSRFQGVTPYTENAVYGTLTQQF